MVHLNIRITQTLITASIIALALFAGHGLLDPGREKV